MYTLYTLSPYTHYTHSPPIHTIPHYTTLYTLYTGEVIDYDEEEGLSRKDGTLNDDVSKAEATSDEIMSYNDAFLLGYLSTKDYTALV